MSNLFNTTGTTAGAATATSGQTVSVFLGGLGTGLAIFGIEVFVFFILHNSLSRIYRPKTYLVPEKERTSPPPATWFSWIVPVFTTSNAELIQKCGLDAYFFLRYLRMLLKIFVPAAVFILPILIPINATNPSKPDVKGLDKLAWNNYDPSRTDRLWVHLVLAVCLLLWVFHVIRGELRGYIRVRQSYLTSPQHRLRASATTVLVTSIPRKWLTYEALNGLYDVMPGGIRNIWINRDFDELDQKIQLRDQLASKLESAETNLIRNAKRMQLEHAAKVEKAKKKGKPIPDLEKASSPTSESHSHTETKPQSSIDLRVETPSDSGLEKTGKTVDLDSPRSERGVNSFEVTTPITITASETPINKVDENAEATAQDVDAGRVTTDTHIPNNGPRAAHHWAQANAAPSRGRGLKFWQGDSHGIRVPSPEPHRQIDTDNVPNDASAAATAGGLEKRATVVNKEVASSKLLGLFTNKNSKAIQEGETYEGTVCNDDYSDDQGFDSEPAWKKYLNASDRDTTRLPLWGQSWLPYMPSWTFIGRKVDVIYHCRKELARLNLEIEQDQKEPEKYPLMNSAFIQFNHQIAAHMACQCVSHHTAHEMAPRLVEIAPSDVIWENLSIKWWERYVRYSIVLVLVCGLVVAWAIPVSFMATISNLTVIANTWPRSFGWIHSIPKWLLSVIQGVFPVLALLVLNILLPIILRLAAKQQGVQTGTLRELSVQTYFFGFSFVQLFLVVTISNSLFKVIGSIIDQPYNAPQILGVNIPKSGNFFFNYMFVQGLSVSAGTLAQLGSLVVWYILRRLLDSTARQKFNRQLNLPTIQWGTFLPVYTVLGCIGLIYSIIAPLILIFAIITFSLFWVVYRYQNLYVIKTTFDTGGLTFPKAVNQFFVGIYFLELSLIGLFFLVRDEQGEVACAPQAIIMIVMAAFTIIFHIMLNVNYSSLYRYMPITLEDEAVLADEEYERIQRKRWEMGETGESQPRTPQSEDIEDRLERRAREEDEEERAAEAIEMQDIKERRRSHNKALGTVTEVASKLNPLNMAATSWAHRRDSPAKNNDSPNPSRSANNLDLTDFARRRLERLERLRLPLELPPELLSGLEGTTGIEIESQKGKATAVGDALFGQFNDEIEDLTPEERDILVQRAFLHKALRARRPVIWIPKDDLGVSADEIRRTQAYSEHISISDEWTGLDEKVRVVIKRAPPDFSEVDLIEL